MSVPSRPLTLLIAALGGEGGGVLRIGLSRPRRASAFPCRARRFPGVRSCEVEQGINFVEQRNARGQTGINLVPSLHGTRA